MHDVIAYCRIGFEAECDAELRERLDALGLRGTCQAALGAAFVRWQYPGVGSPAAIGSLRFDALVFARQVLFGRPLLADLPAGDRVGAIAAAAARPADGFSEIWTQTADGNPAYVGPSRPGNSAGWPMGIPRLKLRRFELRFRQLYHDREEVTGHCRLR